MEKTTDRPAVLLRDERGLALTDGELEIRADFTRMLPRLKQHNLTSELLVKAAKIKKADHALSAVDATAGFGEDALLLAAAGFHVQMYERDPVIAALLADAMKRAEELPELREIVSRMTLTEGDSISAMPAMPAPPDIILLDPMFPERQKNAEVRKKFQLIHLLERPCTDEGALLEAAKAAHPVRIVIKRPVKGPYLAGVKPSYSLTGKAVRYDCIVL